MLRRAAAAADLNNPRTSTNYRAMTMCDRCRILNKLRREFHRRESRISLNNSLEPAISYQTTRILLSLVLLLTVLGICSETAAQEPPTPCGVIVENTTLTGDCVGPLITGADSITVDLGGYSVLNDEDQDDSLYALEVRDRRNVTVKNGSLGGGMGHGPLLIEGGTSNKFTALHILVGEGGTCPSFNTNSSIISNNTFTLNPDGACESGITVLGDNNSFKHNTVLQESDFSTIAFSVRGTHNKVQRNFFFGASGVSLGGSALLFEKNHIDVGSPAGELFDLFTAFAILASDSIIRDNSVSTGAYELFSSAGIVITGDRNRIERNSIKGPGTTVSSTAGTDSPISTYGIFLKATHGNLIKTNKIQSHDIAIFVKSGGTNVITKNNTRKNGQGVVIEPG